MNSEQLKKELQQFIGTTAYHRLSICKTVATDGVLHFCSNAGAFWLFDEIAWFTETQTKEPFVYVIAKSKDNKAEVVFEDGNGKQLGIRTFGYTDLPEGEWTFYVTDGVAMLPSEY